MEEGQAPDGMLNYEQLLIDATPVNDAERSVLDMVGIFSLAAQPVSEKG